MSDDPNPVPETGIEVFKAAPRPPRRRSDRQIVREYLPEIVGKLCPASVGIGVFLDMSE